MRKIPIKLRNQIANDPFMKVCSRKDENCQGRITWEHAFIYAGKQINEKWAIIPLCEYHHLGKGLDKRENEKIAISRATKQDLAKYNKRNWDNYIKNI